MFTTKYIENSTVELKRQVVEDIRKTVIAFANTKGGILYVGIENDGTIVGVEDSDKEMLKISNMIRDGIKPDVTIFVSCTREESESRDIIKVVVQRGTECP